MAVRNASYQPIWAETTSASNPIDGQVMADTGALPLGGIYEVRVIPGATATAAFFLQRRNAANTATVGDPIVFRTVANQTSQFVVLMDALNGERFRVVMNGGVTGTAEAAIQVQNTA